MSSPKEFNNKIRKNSLDDLEIEKIRKETAGSIRKSTGSQDDFSVKSPKLYNDTQILRY